MRTTFSFDDDKQLVQLARSYADQNSRIAWKDVARRMKKTGHTAAALHGRLRSLMRTWGSDLSQFHPSFYTPVQRPRGRPSAAMRRLRAAIIPNVSREASDVPYTTNSTAPGVFEGGGDEELLVVGISSTSAEEAVAAMFADVPRGTVAKFGNTPHLNAGELMPAGVTTLLAALGPLGPDDIFLDIGAGLGNIVAHVALSTDVFRAIGIEVRSDIHMIGYQKMLESPEGSRFRAKVEFICKDVADIRLSTTPPYADTTIAFWNNVLFEPRVVEFVKSELSGIPNLRMVASSVNLCPRHREFCRASFCEAFQFVKTVEVSCSWKDSLLDVFVYKQKSF